MSAANRSQNIFNLTDEELASIVETSLRFERIIGVVIPVIYTLVVLVGLIGNAMVLLVIGVNKQMRNTTNCLVANLAVANLVFLIFCVPFTAIFFAMCRWVFSGWWCKVVGFFQYLSLYGSVWTLALLAVDRFLAVVFPISSRKVRTIRNTGLAVAAMWSVFALGCVPVWREFGVHQYWMPLFQEQRSICAHKGQVSRKASLTEVRVFFFSFNILGFAVPLVLISALYSGLLVRLSSMRQPGGSGVGGSGSGGTKAQKRMSSARVTAKRKITTMSAAVVVTFALCWLPIHLVQALNAAAYPLAFSNSQAFIVATMVAQVLAYSNGCLNPFLYGFFSDNFRKGFYKIFQAACILLRWKGGERWFASRANPRLIHHLSSMAAGGEGGAGQGRGGPPLASRLRSSAKRMSVSLVGEAGLIKTRWNARPGRNGERRGSVIRPLAPTGIVALLQLHQMELSHLSDDDDDQEPPASSSDHQPSQEPPPDSAGGAQESPESHRLLGPQRPVELGPLQRHEPDLPRQDVPVTSV